MASQQEGIMNRTIVKRCPMMAPGCAIQQAIDVDEESFREWQSGALIQNAFPNLNAEERETLITGICPSCWDQVFGGGDDD